MATRKKAEVVVEEPVLTEDEAKAIEDLWKQMVTVRLPKATNGEANSVIASVNGRVFQIKRGIEVDVPAPIAEVLRHSMEAEAEADEYLESLQKEPQ
jgi:hypothetical protein